jgi:hypothetical protein
MSQSTDVKNYLIGGLLIIIVLLTWCNTNKKAEVKPLVKIKKEIVKQIEYREGEVKIVKEVDIKYKTIYKTKYDTIYAQAPDTCKEYLEEFKLVADSALKIKDLVIIKQDSVIVGLKQVTKIDSTIINQYKEDARQLRKEKRIATILTSGMILLTFIGLAL